MDSNSFKKFLETHIKDLEAKLAEIYTIEPPEELPIKSKEKINVEKELLGLVEYEKIYSIIEGEGISEGKIFTKYNKWLNNVRESIIILQREIETIEDQNKADITNCNILLDEFKNKLKNLEDSS